MIEIMDIDKNPSLGACNSHTNVTAFLQTGLFLRFFSRKIASSGLRERVSVRKKMAAFLSSGEIMTSLKN